ncbi:hypothetical protein BDZ91DRAFT_280331 [Kalaharituber pfeilii]|nr:hypothetical protein BDZ91DRAFT_280331 [Kalaharituber pfeilii]
MTRYTHCPQLGTSSQLVGTLYAFLALSGVFIKTASAQEKVCQRWGGSSTLSNGKLFYSGGWYRSSKAKDTAQVSKGLLAVDLAASWEWDEVGLLEVDSVPELFSDMEKNPKPIVLASNTTVYNIFISSDDISGYSISSTSSEAKPETVKLDSSKFGGLANAVYTQSTTNTVGYMIGEDATTKKGIVLASIDIESMEMKTIKTAQTELTLPTQGIIQHIPVGEKGALIYFGGNIGDDKVSMEYIKVLDLSDTTWREQQTTGNAPPTTSKTEIICTAYVQAKDGSSHSIYTFNSDGSVYILSLPSFIWFQIPIESENALNYEPPRENYSKMGACVVAPGLQQIVMLGIGSAEKDKCDSGNGVYVYDMNGLTWVDSYNKAKIGYKIPLQIVRTIGGDSSGGANMDTPERGWSTTGLRKLFSRNGGSSNGDDSESKENDENQNKDEGTDNESEMDPGNGSTTRGTKRKSNTGPIVGGIICAIVVVAVAAFFYYRRCKAHKSTSAALKRTISHSIPTIPPKNQSEHPEVHVDYGDDRTLRSNRNSISQFGSVKDFTSDTNSTRGSTCPFKATFSDSFKHRFSPSSSINRRFTETPSSTLYTPSAIIPEPPDTPYSEQFLRSPKASSPVPNQVDFRAYGHDYIGDTTNVNVNISHSDIYELPAHLPAKAYTTRSGNSTVGGFGELEGDYLFPIEKGGSDVSEQVMGGSSLDKSGKEKRGSKELLLEGHAPGVKRPEEALLADEAGKLSLSKFSDSHSKSAAIKKEKNRSSVDTSNTPSRVLVARSGSLHNSGRKGQEGQGLPNFTDGVKLDDLKNKPLSGKAKLVELKRGPSSQKTDGSAIPRTSTAQPTTIPEQAQECADKRE